MVYIPRAIVKSKPVRRSAGESACGAHYLLLGGEVVPGPNIECSDHGDVLVPGCLVVSVSQVSRGQGRDRCREVAERLVDASHGGGAHGAPASRNPSRRDRPRLLGHGEVSPVRRRRPHHRPGSSREPTRSRESSRAPTGDMAT